ncbi:VOC family protein [Nocardiopsis sp. MG754419]|uniref:VOC family protein n=1 Tax=Nocardiopsis sp. MG754419 TaxID=2259865 RepID=UPI001BA8D270|nr:VOC family protein [Nocardiopsis sp. MG754419]MBR8744316.1 VOC family protein [Nocardiopsis sp. MG754419]
MITTDYVLGSPCWAEVTSPDVDASAAFYGRLFGWEAESAGPETGGYVNFRLEGALVGALSPRMTEDQPIAWTIYLNTPDVDATVAAARDLGATVYVDPMEVMGLGRMAYLADPQGGAVPLWQPRSFPGAEVVDAPGSLMWTELWTPSVVGAKDFYGALLGWEFADVPIGDDTYATIRPAEQGEDRYFGGMMGVPPERLPQTEGAADWHPVFHVVDCDAAVARVREAGGQVYMGPDDAPGVGRLAVCSDPFSAGFVLLTPSPE